MPDENPALPAKPEPASACPETCDRRQPSGFRPIGEIAAKLVAEVRRRREGGCE